VIYFLAKSGASIREAVLVTKYGHKRDPDVRDASQDVNRG